MQILVIELGSQYTLVIGRTLRELGVRSIILAPERARIWLHENRPKGIILSGGYASIYDPDAPEIPAGVLTANVPILGICLGMHWLAREFGGTVEPIQAERGYGAEELSEVVGHDPLFVHVSKSRSIVWMSHGDSVSKLPMDFRRIAGTPHCPIAAMSSGDRRYCGVQFHPEVPETECGKEILRGFLDICKVERDWQPKNILAGIRKGIERSIGPHGQAILGFSGGVDSTTIATIASPILGQRLSCLTIDTGGLRAGELSEIQMNAIAAGTTITIAHAGDRFLPAIHRAGSDAEAKRMAFRGIYQEVLEENAKTLDKIFDATFLLQGTLATDRIESGLTGGHTIKTHHNTGLETNLVLVEPLSDLFKYEVRDFARHLGLPASVTEREPFPGPGLYIRVVGAPVTQEYLELVRSADQSVRDIVKHARLEKPFAQLVVGLFAGIRLVGVKGDKRVYGHPIAIRAVETSDFMTCKGYRFPPEVKQRFEKVLTQDPRIAGVVYDEGDKPPRTTEFE